MDTKTLKDELAKGLKAFKAFEQAHAALAALEGIEQTEREIKKRVDDMRAEEAGLDAERLKAVAAIDEAKKTAAVIIAAGKAEAERMVGAGRNLLDQERADRQKESEQAGIDLDAAKEEIVKEMNSLQDLLKQAAQARADLADLEELKAKARKALGV